MKKSIIKVLLLVMVLSCVFAVACTEITETDKPSLTDVSVSFNADNNNIEIVVDSKYEEAVFTLKLDGEVVLSQEVSTSQITNIAAPSEFGKYNYSLYCSEKKISSGEYDEYIWL